MSVYSGVSRTPSILKRSSTLQDRLNSSAKTTNKVKFVLPHSTNVRNILCDYVKNGYSRDYENLVCSIRDCELTDDDLSSLLRESSECISLLNNDLRLFVDVLLSICWADREDELVEEYQSFLVNLLAAHNYHAKVVIDHLIAIFIPNSEEIWEDGNPSPLDSRKCVNAHSVLNTLLKIVPMCKDIFLQSLINYYPYFKKGTHTNECYLHNLLWVLDYQPWLRPNILHLIFSNLIILDVNAPREIVLKAYSDDEEMFPLDDTKTILSTSMSSDNVVVESLDICLSRMIKYVLSECHHPRTHELEWDRAKKLYKDLIKVFDEIILPTYNIHHIQFCWFVFCGFKPCLAEAFLDHLWKKVIDPSVPSVIRQTSVEYIASLVARASYINVRMLMSILRQLSTWIHAYINTQDGLECVNSDLRVHSVFYSVCQALFYTITFRHRELVDSRKNITFLQSLNLSRIISSRLNPLRVCQPAVVQNFAAFTRNYQLVYCYSVIEHNARNVMPTIYQSEKGSMRQISAVLQANFPFDPLVLRRCSEKIRLQYREYEEFDLSINDDGRDRKDSEMSETDDFLQQDVDLNKSNKFSYGTSPGFKFNIEM